MAYFSYKQIFGGKVGDTAGAHVNTIGYVRDKKLEQVNGARGEMFVYNVLDQDLLRDVLSELKLMNHHLSQITGSDVTTDEL